MSTNPKPQCPKCGEAEHPMVPAPCRYNGWTNYETWCVKLWIDNEEPTYRHWQEAADEALSETEDTPSAYARLVGTEIFTHEQRARYALTMRLADEIKDSAPETEGMYADLLGTALDSVNWDEIASSLLDEARERTEA